MINVGMYYKVKLGSEGEFEKIFGQVVESLLSSNSGMKNAKLYREVGKSEYMILTEWENTDSFSAFIQSRGFKETTTHGKTILEGQPKHKIFYDKI